MDQPFCQFFCHSQSLLLFASSLYHTLLHPGDWDLCFILYLKLNLFVKSPLERSFLEIRDSVSSVFLENILVYSNFYSVGLRAISEFAYLCMYPLFYMYLTLFQMYLDALEMEKTQVPSNNTDFIII